MATKQLFLNGAQVNEGFRDALFDTANKAGVSPLEYCLIAAAERMARRDIVFAGVFRDGDIDFYRERLGQ